MTKPLRYEQFESTHAPTWCPGCGDFAIWTALKRALAQLGIPPHRVLVVYGIGCSGNMVNTVHAYGWHALHGRALPAAVGAKLANPAITVIAVAGDGDAYGEGLSHFIHTIRGNADITYIVHDNRVYGLTTGQAAPTASKGFKAASTPQGLIEEPLNPIMLALSSGVGFVARGYSGNINQLIDMVVQGIRHPGFALVDVLQPCATFNKMNTYEFYNSAIYSLQDDPRFDVSNFNLAMEKAREQKKLPTGIFYRSQARPSYTQELKYLKGKSLVSKKAARRDISKLYKDFI